VILAIRNFIGEKNSDNTQVYDKGICYSADAFVPLDIGLEFVRMSIIPGFDVDRRFANLSYLLGGKSQ